jgi:hypothetical protein
MKIINIEVLLDQKSFKLNLKVLRAGGNLLIISFSSLKHKEKFRGAGRSCLSGGNALPRTILDVIFE